MQKIHMHRNMSKYVQIFTDIHTYIYFTHIYKIYIHKHKYIQRHTYMHTFTRTGGLVVRFGHWTPKGYCKVTGNKERN